MGEMADPTMLNLAHDVRNILISGRYYKVHNPDSGLPDSNPLEGRRREVEYYKDTDIKLGETLDFFGFKVFLYDCDEFTKNYYHATHNIDGVTIRPNKLFARLNTLKTAFKRSKALAVFVDFKSAFDRVWRKMLLKKILHMNVSGRHLFKWISDFLSQRFLNIKYDNFHSGYGQTRQDLPQGSILSPVLFNIMINDLLSFIDNAVPEINSLLYADDLVLWSIGSDILKLESTLNLALVTLANWSLENERDFKVNPDKTNFELFTLSTKKHNINLVYNNNAIRRTDCATYLGISLDSRLTWTKHIAKVVENATSRLSLLKRIDGVKWGLHQSVLTSTFTSYIRPVIDYGSELLVTASDSALSKLDIVQNKALRFISGEATSTPTAFMQLQTEISSSSERRQYSALSLGE
ncbi:RNA-directed DNA polymerase from mobile element jockey [Trichonephila clavipes]|nr:RNA-directed DNA polymerase from mobile element jockey [Trichonephila clavipes]